MPLNIKQEGALDFLALGALVHRLEPGGVPFRKASSCSVHVSGGEFNCAANLADCFRMRTGVATAMVEYPIGDLIAGQVRAMGVTPFYSHRGFGVRAPIVYYNRSNEAASLLKPGDFDWPTVFAGGVRWFHSGGIFASLSEPTSEVLIEGMAAAKSSGAMVSFRSEE